MACRRLEVVRPIAIGRENHGFGASSGAGNYPAKFAFRTDTANCGSATTPDYVVFSTPDSGSGTQASVVAYDNLYAGCSGTRPSVYWAYNTGGQILTSPVISADGKQVAFVETNGGFGILILLKWAAGTGTDQPRYSNRSSRCFLPHLRRSLHDIYLLARWRGRSNR